MLASHIVHIAGLLAQDTGSLTKTVDDGISTVKGWGIGIIGVVAVFMLIGALLTKSIGGVLRIGMAIIAALVLIAIAGTLANRGANDLNQMGSLAPAAAYVSASRL